jgi:hypothetical protein
MLDFHHKFSSELNWNSRRPLSNAQIRVQMKLYDILKIGFSHKMFVQYIKYTSNSDLLLPDDRFLVIVGRPYVKNCKEKHFIPLWKVVMVSFKTWIETVSKQYFNVLSTLFAS